MTQHSGIETYDPNSEQETFSEAELDGFSAPPELLEAQSLANTLDTAIKLPFIGIKVGLDFLIGLIPVVGDIITTAVALRIVYLGNKMGIPKAIRAKMLRNVVIDYLLGFIPIIGDIVDLFFKANQRNVRLVEMWWVQQNKAKIDALRARAVTEWEREHTE